MTRRRLILLSCLMFGAIALAIPAVALATNYWGFNYISSSSPTGQCYLNGGAAGTVCVNTTSDSSQVQKNGGGCVDFGYYVSGSVIITLCSDTTQTISAQSATGHDPAGPPFCAYHSGAKAYIQCRYFNGF